MASRKAGKKGSAGAAGSSVIVASFSRRPWLHCTLHAIAKMTTAISFKLKEDSISPDVATPESCLLTR